MVMVMFMFMFMFPVYIPFFTLAIIAVAVFLRWAAWDNKYKNKYNAASQRRKSPPTGRILPVFYLPFERGKNWLNRPAGSYCALTFCSRATFAPYTVSSGSSPKAKLM
jgi:hypothetical protein